MENKKFNVAVIGSGPGGYVAAIRAAHQGQSVALIEDQETGGVCLNRGCIPSKALIANAEVLRKVRQAEQFGISVGDVSFSYLKMKKRKDAVVEKIRKSLEGLLKSNKISLFKGFGKFDSPHVLKVIGSEEVWIEAENMVIATGSQPRPLPLLPFDYRRIHDSTSLLEITELPKRLVIIGGGVIGCEFACLHRAFDVDVTIVELLPSIISIEGKNISEALASSLKKQGIKIKTNTFVEEMMQTQQKITLRLSDGENVEADQILVSVGRKYNTDRIGLEKTGVVVEADGSIPTNGYLQTNVPHIYAIGDITGKWILAHVASHQGIVAADHIAGKGKEINYQAVPSVIFTQPEIGTVGYTLERAIEAGYDARIGSFPFQALGKSHALMETEGFAQIVVEKKTGQILGAQVMGYGAATLIAEMAVAIGNELTVESISETIHAHPTIAEAWMEAAFAASGLPIHLPPPKEMQ